MCFSIVSAMHVLVRPKCITKTTRKAILNTYTKIIASKKKSHVLSYDPKHEYEISSSLGKCLHLYVIPPVV